MLSENVIVLPEFTTATRVFREVMGTSFCQRIKENELLGGCGLVVAYALRTQKRKDTSIQTTITSNKG